MSTIARNCGAITANGGRCHNRAATGSEWCAAHDPARKEARREAARKGGKRGGRGRAGVSGEIAEQKSRLDKLIDAAIYTDSPKNIGVAIQGINTRIRLMAEEREQRYAQELEERLKATEKALEESRRGQSSAVRA